MESKKIIITGGHLTPAVATIDVLLSRDFKIWYVGRKHTQEFKRLDLYQGKVIFLSITTGRLARYFDSTFFTSVIKIPIGFIQSLYWLVTIRPDIILSFGGYVAVPVCLVAYLLRIPVVTHEQTRLSGLANKIIAHIARKICVSWPDTKKFFDSKKSILTGLPIRKIIFSEKEKLPVQIDKPLIYVTGGSQGSHSINLLFEPIISKLLKDFSIIHQCGDNQTYNDFHKFQKLRETLNDELKKRYLPVIYVDENKIGWVYKHTQFVLGRSGANTIAELAVLAIPAIFIPLPWSGEDEQLENAKLFYDHKAGIILNQNGLTSSELVKMLYTFNQKITYYKKNAGNLKKIITLNGTENLVKIIEQSLNSEKKQNSF